jgi:hypothetical protein
MTMEPPTLQLGEEGEACAQCGAVLATDQRYCLNCGAARAEPRLSFQKFLRPGAEGGADRGPAVQAAGPSGAVATGLNQNATILFGILAIALLGVMLLLGVLIGKDEDPATVAAAPATTTTSAAPAPTAAPAETADAPAPNKDKTAAAGADKAIPGQGDVVQGGSGSTEGIPTADPNASPLENAKNGPDVVATGGDKAELDPEGAAGGGSDAVCIGC